MTAARQAERGAERPCPVPRSAPAPAVHALLPAIHARPTGGNVFNRRTLAALAGTGTAVRRRVVPAGGAVPRLAPGVWLVDSLLLDAVAARLAEAPPGVAAVLLVHHLQLLDPERRDAARAAAERRLLPRFAGAVTTSRYSRGVLVAEGMPAARVAVVAPGLDARYRAAVPERPVAPPPGVTEAPGVPRPGLPRAPRVLTVASLLPGKGLVELLSVLEECADLPWRWEVAGDPGLDPAYAGKLAERLARSPVGGRVRLHGPLPAARLAALYDRCHLFALASRFESCGMAVREAMARALPVAAYAVGGIPESVPRETAHLLAPPGDRARLRQAVRRLLGDAAEREAAGRANRRAAAAFPGWEEAGAALDRFVRRLAMPAPLAQSAESDRSALSGRPERSERTERPDRSERSALSGRSARSGRPGS